MIGTRLLTPASVFLIQHALTINCVRSVWGDMSLCTMCSNDQAAEIARRHALYRHIGYGGQQ